MKTSDEIIRDVEFQLRFSEEAIVLNLGIAFQYEYSQGSVKYSAPYLEMGKELWLSLRYELYELICDRKGKKPVQWVEDLVNGDVRNLILGIVSAITAKYDVGLGIAIPAAALVIKTGITKFCKLKKLTRPKQPVAGMLLEKKKSMREPTSKSKPKLTKQKSKK